MIEESKVLDLFKISKATLRRLEKDGLKYTIGKHNKKLYDPIDVRSLIDLNRSGSRSLVLEQVYTNKEICDKLRVCSQSGIRPSLSANLLVLIISEKGDHCYHDVWDGKNIIFTGTGLRGNQKLKRQNAILNNSNDLSIVIHLFVRLDTNKYVYKGIVCLDPEKEPYQEVEPDISHKDRLVWKFPLILL